MSKYAIIQLLGKQYTVSEGEKITIDSLDKAADEAFEVSDVLLVGDDKKTDVGAPLVKGAKVSLKVVSNQKGAKIRVFKYKSKSRYRRTYGHRQHQTTLEVVSISA